MNLSGLSRVSTQEQEKFVTKNLGSDYIALVNLIGLEPVRLSKNTPRRQMPSGCHYLYDLRLNFVFFGGFFVGCIRPSAEDGQDRQDNAADDVAQNTHHKIADCFPRETKEEDVQGVCNRVVKTAKSKYNDREHNTYGSG